MSIFEPDELEELCNEGFLEAVVYYYQEDRRGDGEDRIKIGWSENGPEQRLVQIQNSSPMYLRTWEPDYLDRRMERNRHQEFGDLLVTGLREWFHPGKRLLDHISFLLKENGRYSTGRRIGYLDDRYISMLREFGPYVVESVWRTAKRWKESGLQPGADNVIREVKPEHQQFIAEVERHWRAVTGKNGSTFWFLFGSREATDERVFDCLSKLRRGLNLSCPMAREAYDKGIHEALIAYRKGEQK